MNITTFVIAFLVGVGWLCLVVWKWNAIWPILDRYYPANKIFKTKETARIAHAITTVGFLIFVVVFALRSSI